MLDPLPPQVTDRSPRPVDAKLWTYTARRPAAEWVFAKVAAAEPRIRLRRGVRVESLIEGPRVDGRVPHVVGVRTTDGETLHADLVVDATGRGSRAPAWLAEIGARAPHEERSECAFVYHTRYFTGRVPERMGPVLMPIGTIAVLTLPGDHATWSVTIQAITSDTALKRLKDADAWTNVIRACPLHAHWLDGEPIGDVLSMSGVLDRYRRFVVDGAPIVTGFVAIADAWACTNPSAGRGITVGMMHAVRLRDALRQQRGDDWSSFATQLRRGDRSRDHAVVPRAVGGGPDVLAQIRRIAPGACRSRAVTRCRVVWTGASAPCSATAAAVPRAAMEYIGTVSPIRTFCIGPRWRRPSIAR